MEALLGASALMVCVDRSGRRFEQNWSRTLAKKFNQSWTLEATTRGQVIPNLLGALTVLQKPIHDHYTYYVLRMLDLEFPLLHCTPSTTVVTAQAFSG